MLQKKFMPTLEKKSCRLDHTRASFASSICVIALFSTCPYLTRSIKRTKQHATSRFASNLGRGCKMTRCIYADLMSLAMTKHIVIMHLKRRSWTRISGKVKSSATTTTVWTGITVKSQYTELHSWMKPWRNSSTLAVQDISRKTPIQNKHRWFDTILFFKSDWMSLMEAIVSEAW